MRDPAYFALVRIDPELGSVAWPNGADLDPDVLYGRLTGMPIFQSQTPVWHISGWRTLESYTQWMDPCLISGLAHGRRALV